MSKEREKLLEMALCFLRRYRNETPVGNQPYMICHEVDAFLYYVASIPPDPVVQVPPEFELPEHLDPVTSDELSELLAAVRWYGSTKYSEGGGHARRDLLDQRKGWSGVYAAAQKLVYSLTAKGRITDGHS